MHEMTHSYITLAVSCTFICPFAFGASDYACFCGSYGCTFDKNSCSLDKNCKKENIALGKRTTQSSFQSSLNSPDDQLLSCMAVNGNTNTTYIPPSTKNATPNCIVTNSLDRHPYWQVDLGKNYTITDFTVYASDTMTRHMKGIHISVDDQLCYMFPVQSSDIPVQSNLKCNQPLKGRFVKVYKLFQIKPGVTSLDDHIITICEFQVWVCKSGFYGAGCQNQCSEGCLGECDRFYGTCSGGCKKGYFANVCTRCPKCDGDVDCSANGLCPASCGDGSMKNNCSEGISEEETEQRSTTEIALNYVFGTFAVFALLSAIAILIYIRLKSNVSNDTERSTEQEIPENLMPYGKVYGLGFRPNASKAKFIVCKVSSRNAVTLDRIPEEEEVEESNFDKDVNRGEYEEYEDESMDDDTSCDEGAGYFWN